MNCWRTSAPNCCTCATRQPRRPTRRCWSTRAYWGISWTNDFLEQADALVAELGLEGVLQVASFHPDYQFAGTEPDDVENFTNRSPYPTLHLLREDSVSRAVEAFPDPDAIVDRNVETLRRLGRDGWRALFE